MEKLSHTITFHPNGTATTLYTDKLPLRELGTLTVRRASTIEFNNCSQEWEVFLIVDTGDRIPESSSSPQSEIRNPHFHHPSREECLRWEHEQLNQ